MNAKEYFNEDNSGEFWFNGERYLIVTPNQIDSYHQHKLSEITEEIDMKIKQLQLEWDDPEILDKNRIAMKLNIYGDIFNLLKVER